SPHAVCGKDADCDGKFIDSTEQCDDGNKNNGDGCDANCKTEPPKVLTGMVTGSPTQVVGTISGVPGIKIKIIKIGICGDSDATSGPNQFQASGGGINFTWEAGQSGQGSTHVLSPTPNKGGSARGFSYKDVSYTADVGQGKTISFTFHNDYDALYCQDTDTQGTNYNDSGTVSSVRPWVLYAYEL
ncbi:MAG: hypothetical protein FJ109_07200, partial [Deltaproteobacteria bacterium]|nr:hypothetical protein [Deltaproteobacteria bacterium]